MSFIVNKGKDNEIIVKKYFSKMNTTVIINGNNNKVYLDDDIKIRHCKIVLNGDNNELFIYNNASLNKTRIDIRDGSTVTIGVHTTIGAVTLTAREGKKISIGEDCMIASDCEIRTSDMHPVYLLETGERINMAQNVEIGNHVWIAKRVLIGKNSKISDCSVVAQGTVVVKQFTESNVIIGGNPSEIIKTNIIWGRSTSFSSMWDDPRLHKYAKRQGTPDNA